MIGPIIAPARFQERRISPVVSQIVMQKNEWDELPSFRRVRRTRRWPRLAAWFGLGLLLGAAGTALL
jgi:hypothetical protein